MSMQAFGLAGVLIGKDKGTGVLMRKAAHLLNVLMKSYSVRLAFSLDHNSKGCRKKVL